MAHMFVYMLNYALEQQEKRIYEKEKEKQEALLKAWKNTLSHWDTKNNLRVAKQLAYSQDIPNEIRSNVWFITSGARDLMCQNDNVYEQLIEIKPNNKCLKQIEKDYRRSLGSKKMNVKYKDRLRRILIAYCNYNPSVPYTQGMNFIAAFTLKQYLEHAPPITFINDNNEQESKIENEIVNDYWLNCIEEQAFWTFAAIMRNISALFCDDLIGFHKSVACFKKSVACHGPKDLVAHLDDENVYPMICTKWYHTLFTYCGMNENIVKRVWDIFLLEKMDFSIILKISYLILIRHKESLMKMDLMDIMTFCDSSKCFILDGNDDHELIYKISTLELKEVYLKPIRNLQHDKVHSKKEGIATNKKIYCRLR